MARDLIARSLAAGQDREKLRTRARIYAGYADHFLQDSYAAGHLVNKTLVMQWYIEWLADARMPCLDRHVLAGMTTSRQPFLHGPDHYNRIAAWPGGYPRPPWDPQDVVEAPTLQARIEASGVVGSSDQERRDAYAAYLAMLGSTVAELAASLLHGYFNKRSLVVAAGPDGPPFRIHGDRRLLAGGDGALHAARATAASRRAIAELLAHGETGITCQEIFDALPDYVEHEGTLVSLPKWHDSSLRDLCFGELFSLRRTSATRILVRRLPPVRRALTGRRGPAERVTRLAHYRLFHDGLHGQAGYLRPVARARGPVRPLRGLQRVLVHVLAHRPAVPRPAARGQQGGSQAARGVRAAARPARLRRGPGRRMVRARPACRIGLAGTRPLPRAGR